MGYFKIPVVLIVGIVSTVSSMHLSSFGRGAFGEASSPFGGGGTGFFPGRFQRGGLSQLGGSMFPVGRRLSRDLSYGYDLGRGGLPFGGSVIGRTSRFPGARVIGGGVSGFPDISATGGLSPFADRRSLSIRRGSRFGGPSPFVSSGWSQVGDATPIGTGSSLRRRSGSNRLSSLGGRSLLGRAQRFGGRSASFLPRGISRFGSRRGLGISENPRDLLAQLRRTLGAQARLTTSRGGIPTIRIPARSTHTSRPAIGQRREALPLGAAAIDPRLPANAAGARRHPDDVLALFAVDDLNNNINNGLGGLIDIPLAAETIGHSVKREPIAKKTGATDVTSTTVDTASLTSSIIDTASKVVDTGAIATTSLDKLGESAHIDTTHHGIDSPSTIGDVILDPLISDVQATTGDVIVDQITPVDVAASADTNVSGSAVVDTVASIKTAITDADSVSINVNQTVDAPTSQTASATADVSPIVESGNVITLAETQSTSTDTTPVESVAVVIEPSVTTESSSGVVVDESAIVADVSGAAGVIAAEATPTEVPLEIIIPVEATGTEKALIDATSAVDATSVIEAVPVIETVPVDSAVVIATADSSAAIIDTPVKEVAVVDASADGTAVVVETVPVEASTVR